MPGKVIRWWLIGILFFFPFNTPLVKYFKSHHYNSSYIRYIDEITIAVLIFFAIWKLYKRKEILDNLVLILVIPLVVFFLFGLMSGIVNGNSVTITFLGTFDYIKSFLIIFIYAAFFRDIHSFKSIFRLLLIMAVIVSVLAIIQELWALFFRYILRKDILDSSMYLFRDPPLSVPQSSSNWRFGMLRTGALFINRNILGYFNLLIITIYIFTYRKIKLFVLIPLLIAIIFTVSRTTYTGLFILAVMVWIIRKYNNKKLITASVIFIMMAIITLSFVQIDIDRQGLEKRGAITYREYAARKCMEVWRDHPLIGAGPGMFGGVISMTYNSPLYKQYKYKMGLLKTIGSIDQFWPQLFAETGTFGFILFAGILMALIRTLLMIKRSTVSKESKSLVTALLIFLFIVFPFTFGTGFNNVSVVFHFFAFSGMTLGYTLDSGKRVTI